MSDHTRLSYFRGSRSAEVEAYDDTEFEVTLMCGLPGSGKTHWVREQRSGAEVVSLDDLRDALGIDPSADQTRVVHAAMDRARALLRDRRPFVWDATNLVLHRRSRIIETCLAHRARVVIVAVESPHHELLRQNVARHRVVPAKALDVMLRRWEMPDETEVHRIVRVGWS